MFVFEKNSYGDAFAAALSRDETPSLGPGGSASDATEQALRNLSLATAFPRDVRNQDMARCCLSAAWLLQDELDESHEISQSIHTTTGSYWHAIMHRREPDYSNSKYWFRRVGDHPVYDILNEEAAALCDNSSATAAGLIGGQGSWDPFRFVDLCESYYRTGRDDEAFCRKIALLEWQLLFDYCFRNAMG